MYTDENGNTQADFPEWYIRGMYAKACGNGSTKSFDEMMQVARAEVWAKAYFAGYADGRDDIPDLPLNPYTGETVDEKYAH